MTLTSWTDEEIPASKSFTLFDHQCRSVGTDAHPVKPELIYQRITNRNKPYTALELKLIHQIGTFCGPQSKITEILKNEAPEASSSDSQKDINPVPAALSIPKAH